MSTEKEDLDIRDSEIVGKITRRGFQEFRNILQGIIGLADMLDGDPSLPEKVKISMNAMKQLGGG